MMNLFYFFLLLLLFLLVYTNESYMCDMAFNREMNLEIFNLLERTVLKILDFELLLSYDALKEFLQKYARKTSQKLKEILDSDLYKDCFYVEKKDHHHH